MLCAEAECSMLTQRQKIAIPLPNIDQFKVIDQQKSQIAREAKEEIHIPKLFLNSTEMLAKWLSPVYLILF